MDRIAKIRLLKNFAAGKVSLRELQEKFPVTDIYLRNGQAIDGDRYFEWMMTMLNSDGSLPFVWEQGKEGDVPTTRVMLSYQPAGFEGHRPSSVISAHFKDGKRLPKRDKSGLQQSIADESKPVRTVYNILDELPHYIQTEMPQLLREVKQSYEKEKAYIEERTGYLYEDLYKNEYNDVKRRVWQ
jgi:hypothetical protein